MKSFFVAPTLFFVLLLISCGGEMRSPTSTEDTHGTATATKETGIRVYVSDSAFTRLSPDELRSIMNEEDFLLVNVHVPFAGNIPGTDLTIPYNEIEANLDKLPADKDAKIVLYCLGGPMSFDAAETLVDLGYTNVSDLNGGMEAWQRAGFRLKRA